MTKILVIKITKKSFRKKCSSCCYSGRLWHMTRLINSNQHSQHPKNHKKQPETGKQVSQWIGEIELISKKVWGKRKEKIFRLRSWLLLHVKQYESFFEKHLSSKNVIYIARYLYILLGDMIMMMKWLCTYWPTINKETSLNKPTSKRKLFKK